MDVDEAEVEVEVTPTPEEQAQLTFAAQFTPFPFTHDVRNAIFSRRNVMSGELVFDLLLEQASIASPQSLYPPDSPESLHHLLNAIANCPWDILKKTCLQFYLLSHISPTVAAQHATTHALPPQFIHLAHACFLLDSGSPEDLSSAVTLLADARIIQDLSSKVLHTLSLASQPISSSLIRTYVRTAQPVIEAYEDLAIYVRALMEYSLADAWSFQRTFSETTPTRNQLVRTILDSCLIPPKPKVLPHLLSIPLTSFEFSLLQSYALTPSEDLTPAAHAILQDLITVRLLHSGKYSDAIRLSRAFDTLNTKSRTSTGAPLHKAAEERQQMMRDVLAVIPEVQRRELEDELSDISDSVLGTSWTNVGNDISTSWENLGASRTKDKNVLRSGRLEGSPAPGGSSVLFNPFTPGQKRKSSGLAPTNIFGTPVSSNKPALVLPAIPTPNLPISKITSNTPMLSGLSQTPRFNLTSTTHQSPITPRASTGLSTRNTPYRPEPSRGSEPLFSRPVEATTTPKKRTIHGEGKASNEDQQVREQQPMNATDSEQAPDEDIMMVDSDDPDAFVVHGRRRQSQIQQQDTATEPPTGNAPLPGTSLFGRTTHKTDESQPKNETKVLPGGFTSMELMGDAPPDPTPLPQPVEENNRLSREPRRSRGSPHHSETSEGRHLKIPGALFDDEDEQQDRVPSLPPPPPPAKGGRRTRANRASSVATESGDEDEPARPLRRSSRLSSSEPSSPQKMEKTPKRSTRESTGRRKRKAGNE